MIRVRFRYNSLDRGFHLFEHEKRATQAHFVASFISVERFMCPKKREGKRIQRQHHHYFLNTRVVYSFDYRCHGNEQSSRTARMKNSLKIVSNNLRQRRDSRRRKLFLAGVNDSEVPVVLLIITLFVSRNCSQQLLRLRNVIKYFRKQSEWLISCEDCFSSSSNPHSGAHPFRRHVQEAARRSNNVFLK